MPSIYRTPNPRKDTRRARKAHASLGLVPVNPATVALERKAREAELDRMLAPRHEPLQALEDRQ